MNAELIFEPPRINFDVTLFLLCKWVTSVFPVTKNFYEIDEATLRVGTATTSGGIARRPMFYERDRGLRLINL